MADGIPDYNHNPELQPRPYLRLEFRPTDKVNRDGVAVVEDVLWALVMSPGSKDVLERPASEWLDSLERHAKGGRIPARWPQEYRAACEEWVKTQQLPVFGTPIKTWPPLTAAQRVTLARANIHTVEDLAGAPEDVRARIGIGSEGLVNMAKKWLASSGQVSEMARQVETLTRDNAELQERVQALQGEVANLTTRLAMASSSIPVKA